VDSELTPEKIQVRALTALLVVVLLIAGFIGNRAYQEIGDLQDSVDELWSEVTDLRIDTDSLQSDGSSIQDNANSLGYDVEQLQNTVDTVCAVLNQMFYSRDITIC